MTTAALLLCRQLHLMPLLLERAPQQLLHCAQSALHSFGGLHLYRGQLLRQHRLLCALGVQRTHDACCHLLQLLAHHGNYGRLLLLLWLLRRRRLRRRRCGCAVALEWLL